MSTGTSRSMLHRARNTKPVTRSVARYASQAMTQSSESPHIDNSLSPEQAAQLDLDPIWLRDLCPCADCVDPSSGQKKFWTVDIPHNIKIKSRTIAEDGTLEYTWENDVPGAPAGHTTRLQSSQIQDGFTQPPSISDAGKQYWNAAELSSRLFTISYEDYTTSAPAFRSALTALHRDGIFFVSSVPDSEESIVSIANRIGPLRHTFYGPTWDVKSVPQAKNVAYTSGHLGFHQDLLYMSDPPRLQFLHCIRSSAAGGASLFADGFRAAKDLQTSDPEAFEDLTRLNTTFHYRKDGKHYLQSRPTVDLYENTDRLRAINWSPPFQGPQRDIADPEATRRWHGAANKYRDAAEKEGMVWQKLMRPGECVVFDNKRVLHARTAFEPGDHGTERWLKGCYVDADPYWSALRCNAQEE